MISHKTSPKSQKVAYIMSRFPKLTETFILFEMLAVEVAGTSIEIYPLLRAKNTSVKVEGANLWNKILERIKKNVNPIIMHPEAIPYVERAHFFPFFSFSIFLSQIYYVFTNPFVYFGTLITIIRANLGSANYLIGALAIYPKSVYMARHMQRNDITHVHAHFANHPATAAFIVHRITGIPFSFTAHGADFQVDQHMLTEKISESIFTITVSHDNKKFLVDSCGQQLEDKIKVLYCGVDTAIFNATSSTMLPPISTNTFTLVTIGTFYEVKGHAYLIEACRRLKEQGVNFKTYLIGSGPFQSKLVRQVVESDLQDHVIFCGQKTRQEIADILRLADVLVLPSIPTTSGRREGLPVVLMEAMASGVPVIASNISGIPELVSNEKNGLIVPPKDSIALANALNKLYNDEELGRKLGNAGRKTILKNFNLTKNANMLISMIEESSKP